MPFSLTDNLIDIIIAIIFLYAIFKSFVVMHNQDVTIQGKIMAFFIFTIASLQVFQTLQQVTTSQFANFRVWDLINYLTVMFFLATLARITVVEKVEVEKVSKRT